MLTSAVPAHGNAAPVADPREGDPPSAKSSPEKSSNPNGALDKSTEKETPRSDGVNSEGSVGGTASGLPTQEEEDAQAKDLEIQLQLTQLVKGLSTAKKRSFLAAALGSDDGHSPRPPTPLSPRPSAANLGGASGQSASIDPPLHTTPSSSPAPETAAPKPKVASGWVGVVKTDSSHLLTGQTIPSVVMATLGRKMNISLADVTPFALSSFNAGHLKYSTTRTKTESGAHIDTMITGENSSIIARDCALDKGTWLDARRNLARAIFSPNSGVPEEFHAFWTDSLQYIEAHDQAVDGTAWSVFARTDVRLRNQYFAAPHDFNPIIFDRFFQTEFLQYLSDKSATNAAASTSVQTLQVPGQAPAAIQALARWTTDTAANHSPFQGAPGARPTPGAGSARADIARAHVQHQGAMHGMILNEGSRCVHQTGWSSVEATIDGAALPLRAPSSTSALRAEALRTQLAQQLAEERAQVICQYDADAFHAALSRFHLLNKHPTLVHYLRHGFPMALNPLIPLPTTTFLPPNHTSATDTLEHRQFVINYLSDESKAGRVSQPYPVDVIQEVYGHVRSSPLGVIDKATPVGQPQKYRLITDASHLDSDGVSINSLIDSDEFPTLWHDVPFVSRKILSLPCGTLFCVGDVTACFRNNGWSPRDKAFAAIRDVAQPDLIRIDHAVSFGFASGPGVAGLVMDGLLGILAGYGIEAYKWVDDFLFANPPLSLPGVPTPTSFTPYTIRFSFPKDITINRFSSLADSLASIPQRLAPGVDPPPGHGILTFTYAFTKSDIIDVTRPLGLPWSESKWQDFSFLVQYLGFLWDTWNKRIWVPDEKVDKYVARITAVLNADSAGLGIRLQQMEKVHGCLMHISFVVTLGLSHLPGIQRFMTGFKGSRFSSRHLTPAARSDLQWWHITLLGPRTVRTIVDRGPTINREISVDASTSFGIGLRVGNSYMAWKWLPHALIAGSGRNIGGAEAIGLEFALRYLRAIGVVGERTSVLGDNTSTNGAFARGRGRNIWTNESIRRSAALQVEIDGELDVTYVKSEDNPADPVSRGDFTGLTRLDFDVAALCSPWVFAQTDSWTEWPMLKSVGRSPPKSLQLPPSPYRPQVQAGDRVACWTSPQIIAHRREILAEPWRIQVALDTERAYSHTWEIGTRRGHGAGLIRYAEYCHSRGIPEAARFPAHEELLVGFISWAAGRLGASAVDNWLSGIRAWHIYHGFPYPGEGSIRVKAALAAVAKTAPITSKREARPPVTTLHLNALYHGLSFTNAFDIAVWAAACTAFWGLARLGELTTPSLVFDPSRHAARSTGIRWNTDGHIRSVSVDIPWTKTTKTAGATLLLTEEKYELSCPYRALTAHFKANGGLSQAGHLFGYSTVNGTIQPLVKPAMLARCEEVWTAAGLNLALGHSFRIGGTSHLLARGTDVQIVQRLGRWSSDAFFLYWRNAQAIIPLHIASAADRDAMMARVEEYLEGADWEVRQVWATIQETRRADLTAKSRATSKPKAAKTSAAKKKSNISSVDR